jgi:hypothetical protein
LERTDTSREVPFLDREPDSKLCHGSGTLMRRNPATPRSFWPPRTVARRRGRSRKSARAASLLVASLRKPGPKPEPAGLKRREQSAS